MASGSNPVSVLLGNHELLVVLFAGVVWLLRKLGVTAKKAAGRPAPGGQVQKAQGGTDEEVAARTRRVQDDVRRKIAERRAAAGRYPTAPDSPRRSSRLPATALATAGPASEDGQASDDEPPLMVPRVVEETEPDDEAIEFARQQKLESQLRDLDAARGAAARQAAMISASGPIPVGQAAGVAALPPPNPWLAELRDPSTVRRAILLREILGPPVCLKGNF